MKFHPGGIEELMKGAGINATDLFNDVIFYLCSINLNEILKMIFLLNNE
jgi:hypothetical protein